MSDPVPFSEDGIAPETSYQKNSGVHAREAPVPVLDSLYWLVYLDKTGLPRIADRANRQSDQSQQAMSRSSSHRLSKVKLITFPTTPSRW